MQIRARRWIFGYISLRMSGNEAERFFNMCRFHHILIWDIYIQKDDYYFQMDVKDFKRIKEIIRKTGQHIRIDERFGFPFLIHRYYKRWGLLLGSVACLGIIAFSSTRLWEIELEGNQAITSVSLYDYLRSKRLYPGRNMSSISCEELEKNIRNDFPKFIWVSVAKNGTHLNIQVKERIGMNDGKEEESTHSLPDLVSDKDGRIVKIVTSRGTPLVHENERVMKGQVLVSGSIPIVSDDGEITGYQTCKPEATILMEYEEPYLERLNRTYDEKTAKKMHGKAFAIRINGIHGEWGFHLPMKKDSNNLKVQECQEHKLYLNPSYPLPFTVLGKTESYYRMVEKKYTRKEMQKILTDHFSLYCHRNTQKKVEIMQKNVKIYIVSDYAEAKGSLTLRKEFHTK